MQNWRQGSGRAGNGKITEKQLRKVLISSVCSMLLCMSCLAGTTWALFTSTISSENVLTMGTAEITLTVESQTEEAAEVTAEGLTTGNYQVFVTNTGSAAGYGEIIFTETETGEETIVYTPLLEAGGEGIRFALILNEACSVNVISCWETGKLAEELVTVQDNGEVTIGVPPEKPEDPEQNEELAAPEEGEEASEEAVDETQPQQNTETEAGETAATEETIAAETEETETPAVTDQTEPSEES